MRIVDSKAITALLDNVLSNATDKAERSVEHRIMELLGTDISAREVFQMLAREQLMDEEQTRQYEALDLHESLMSGDPLPGRRNSSHMSMIGSSSTHAESSHESNAQDEFGRSLIEINEQGTDTDGREVPDMNYGVVVDRLRVFWSHNFRNRITLKRTPFFFLFCAISLMGMLSCFGCMMHPGPRPHPPRSHAHVGDAGPPYVGTATLKVPPAWSAERAHWYSLRAWLSDLILWSASTDVEPARQGPIAALQISGAARELVREIPPNVLQNGRVDPQTGAHTAGLRVLAETLITRYGPLKAEISTRAISELIHIRRMQHEPVDAFLVRFDVLRNRAANRAGMAVNYNGLSWILLNALGIGPDQWDRLLFHNDGRLPENQDEFNLLTDRIRRTGHLHEGNMFHRGQGATGDTGQYFQQTEPLLGATYFPTFTGNANMEGANPFRPDATSPFASMQSFLGSASAPLAPGASASSSTGLDRVVGANANHSSAFVSDADMCCQTCGMFFEDEDLSSATDTDDGEFDPEAASSYQYISIDGQTRSDDCALGNAIYYDYLVAKRRWRRFSGRPPRRYRRFTNRQDVRNRQRHRLSNGPYSNTFASFLPSGAFAGGQGKGHGKGKGKLTRKNPRGKDGKVLLCAKCGSDSHLWRQCPRGSGQSGPNTGSPPSMAMLTHVLPGVSFNYVSGNAGAENRSQGTVEEYHIATRSGSRRSSAVFDAELESLRSVATSSSRDRRQGTESSRSSQKRNTDNAGLNDDSDAGSVPQKPFEPSKAMSQSSVVLSASVDAFMRGQTVSQQSGQSSSAFGNQSMYPFVFAQGADSLSFHPSSNASHSELPAAEVTRAESVHSTSGEAARTSQDVPVESIVPAQVTPDRSTTEFLSVAASPSTVYGSPISEVPAKATPPKKRLVLSDLLGDYPWWEATTSPAEKSSDPVSYHARTRIAGQVGLLVDPGAHDNLIGSETCELMEQQLNTKSATKRLNRPLVVSGVGKSSQEAETSATLDCAYRTMDDRVLAGSYTAPVVPNSSLPPLLGLKSLRSKGAIVDTKTPALILPGPGGLEFRLSPGSQVHKLELSDSGHLILPISSSNAASTNQNSRVDDTRLEFAMQCRQNRSRSQSRSCSASPRREAQ